MTVSHEWWCGDTCLLVRLNQFVWGGCEPPATDCKKDLTMTETHDTTTLYDDRDGAKRRVLTVRLSRPLQGDEGSLVVEAANDEGKDRGTIDVVCDDPALNWELA